MAAALLAVLILGFGAATAAAQSFTLTLQPNTIPAGTSGTAYSQLITAVGGNAPYTFAVTSGSLPPGLSLASDGTLSGTPTTPNTYSFTITATDIDSNTGYRPYTFTIGTAGGLTINPSSLPNGTQGTAYSQTVSASGGSGGYTYSINSGSLPPGLSINAGTGTISGTPSSGGAYTFRVFARDSNGNTGTRNYTLNIGTNSLTLSPATLPNGTQGTAYAQTVSASGGTGPYTFAVSSGSLPTGLSLAANGDITGTPSAAGSYTVTIRATDSLSNFGTRSYTINIGSNILTVSPATLPNATVGTGYSQTISASGGTAPYTFTVTSGALPAGLSLSTGGVLSGTPTASGTATFTVQATDPGFNTGTRSYTMTVNAAPLVISPSTLPAGTLGASYSRTLTASGGTAPYSFMVLSGSLPNGLSLSSGGVISGTPTAAGSFTFTVQATDATPNTGTRSYTIVIGSAILTVTPASLPNGTQGTAYSQSVGASGGSAPYTFAVTAGALPAGLSLDTNSGAISGTPSGNGISNFTIGALDSAGNTGSRAYSVNIGTNSLTINPASLPNGSQNVAYSQTVSASGGTGPYTYAISAGALPAGLTLNTANGAISGTPTSGGASSFTVRATDTLGNTGTRAYAVNIGTASLTINPATLPVPVVNRSYRQTIAASGGTGPYTYSLTAGSLPPGLTLNGSTGVISGTPTAAGTYSFTVSALDSLGNSGARAYVLAGRPDPALDPEVQGLVMAQVAATQRFASAQIDNVTQRLDRLHGEFDPCTFAFGIAPAPAQPVYGGPYGAPYQGYAQPLYPSAPTYPAGPGNPNGQGATSCASDWASSLSFWTAGSVQFGKVTPSGLSDANTMMSSGLTAGVDARVHERLIVGAAVGYGTDRTDVGSNGTRSNGIAYSGTLYASFHPFDPVFVDASVGFGKLGFDNLRYVTGDGSVVSGTRSGTYWSGSVSASLEMQAQDVKIAPYVRGEYMSAKLDGYTESGSSAQALTYQQSSFNATSAAIGLRGSVDMPVSFGVLSPHARVEYKQTMQSAYDQTMFYPDLGSGTASTFSQGPGHYGSVTGAVGLRARSADGGLTTDLEYAVTSGTGSLLLQTIRAVLRLAF